MAIEPEIDADAIAVIEKTTRTERFMKSEAARNRRQEAKFVMDSHAYKADKEDRERMKAKRQMEKLQKKKLRKETISE